MRLPVLPATPGVYLFYDRRGRLLYVGKASSLRQRVKSYFAPRREERPVTRQWSAVARIKVEQTATVLEAALKEAALIQAHQPPYNVKQKDDKSWLWIVFTAEEYPRVLVVREKDLAAAGAGNKKLYPRRWGPFTNARYARRALDILRKVFPWSDCRPGQKRPCLNAALGRCPGVCTRALTPTAYKKILRPLALFLDGRRDFLLRQLQAAMRRAVRRRDFETAGHVRDQLFALQHISDVALIGSETARDNAAENIPSAPLLQRVEGYDVSHFSGSNPVAALVVFINGQAERGLYRQFKINTAPAHDDLAALQEVLQRRLQHAEWPLPTLFLVDGGAGQVKIMEKVLRQAHKKIPVIGLAKGPTRKNINFVFSSPAPAVGQVVRLYRHVLIAVRDEAHRCALGFQRRRRRLV